MNWFRVENITDVMTPFPTRVLEDGVIPLRFTLNFEKLTYIPQLTFHVQSRGFSELVKEYPVASDGAASAHHIKFIYSEKATKYFHISTVDWPYVVPFKSTVIHYLKNKVGVVDFANAQGLVMF